MPQSQRPMIGGPPTGKAQSDAKRMGRYRARHRAGGLRAVTRLEAPVQALSPGALKDRILDARSLAMHCLAAAKIEHDRALLREVKKTFDGWRARYKVEIPPALEECRRRLERPWVEGCAGSTNPRERDSRLARITPC